MGKPAVDNPDAAKSNGSDIQEFAYHLAVLAAVFGAGLFAYATYVVVREFTLWEIVLKDHFSAIIGLPAAALLSFALVMFLRQAEGPIEFEGLGFKFKGASGQVAMWIACFLSIAAAIKLCW